MKPLTWLASYVTTFVNRKKMGFYIYNATPFQNFHKTASNQLINTFTVSTICRSYLSHQHPPSFTWYLSAIPVSLSFCTLLTIITKGYKIQHWHSFVRVMCVAKVKSNHRSATSPCTRLSQSVRRLHNSARSLHRIDRRDHRNYLVTNPAVHTENCSSSAQTHITQTKRNGQWWEQFTSNDLCKFFQGSKDGLRRTGRQLLATLFPI